MSVAHDHIHLRREEEEEGEHPRMACAYGDAEEQVRR